jgi:molybdopterin molybdotransferase
VGEPVFSFFKLQTREEALAHLERFKRLPSERVTLDEAHGRVLAEKIVSSEDLPAFRRSTMDGFAALAKDVFGAGESSPTELAVVGEVAMGKPAGLTLHTGETARVWTGGMIPDGADAVVMLEYAREVDATHIELTRPVAPGGNVAQVGEDVHAGQQVLPTGRRLRPQDIGLLSALGVVDVPVVRRPKVAILSTGNEIVAAGQTPAPGQIRDVNTHTLAAMTRALGATPVLLGVVTDDPARLKQAVTRGLAEADLVLVSGGSSVGTADWTLRTFMSFDQAELLVHGVAIKPGKPVILVEVAGQALVGLPGHVASALVTFELFVRPLLSDRLLGVTPEPGQTARAVLSRNVAAAPGRENWLSVRLENTESGTTAVPILGGSGLIATLVQAHGLISVPLGSEGLLAGTLVDVHLF